MEQSDGDRGGGYHWSEWAASLCLGAVLAALLLKVHPGGAEPHPAPVVGELSFSGAGKSGDFLLVLTLAAGSLGALALIAACRRWSRKRNSRAVGGSRAEDHP
mgnify:CR=1 FL=1